MTSGTDLDAAWALVTTWYERDGVADACLELQDVYGIDVVALLACAWDATTSGVADPDLYDAFVADGWQGGVVRPLRSLRRTLPPERGRSGEVRRAVAAAEVEAEHAQFERHLELIERRRGSAPSLGYAPSAVVEQLAAIAQRTRSAVQFEQLGETLAIVALAIEPTLDRSAVVATILSGMTRPVSSAHTGSTTSAAPWRLACLQIASPTDEPLEVRVDRIVGEIARVAETERPDAVVLPELWTTGFFHFDRYGTEAQPIDGAITTALADAATRHSVWLFGGSFIERAADRRWHNTSVCIAPDGELVAQYRKIHLFGYESAEARSLTPGTLPIVVDTPIGRVGLATCYDLRFPELFRRLVDAGAEMFVVASAWPAARRDHWELLLRARAVENLAWVVACNSAGEQAGTALAGASSIISPWGEPIAVAGDGPAVLCVDVDPSVAARRRNEFPSLSDRRSLPAAQRCGRSTQPSNAEGDLSPL